MSGISNIDIVLDSDINHNITIYNFESIKIRGNNFTINGKVYVINFKTFTLSGATVVNDDGYTIDLNRGAYAYVDNTIVRGAGRIHAISVNTVLNAVTYEGSAEKAVVAAEGSQVTLNSCNLNQKAVDCRLPIALDPTTAANMYESFYVTISSNPMNMYTSLGNNTFVINNIRSACHLHTRSISIDGVVESGQFMVIAESLQNNKMYISVFDNTNHTRREYFNDNGTLYTL